ncbi:hypothetical protein M8J77_016429 [Diaphorina citri]|nr:hypothetical protein M8J77_016429 [Diaphorina citri]
METTLLGKTLLVILMTIAIVTSMSHGTVGLSATFGNSSVAKIHSDLTNASNFPAFSSDLTNTSSSLASIPLDFARNCSDLTNASSCRRISSDSISNSSEVPGKSSGFSEISSDTTRNSIDLTNNSSSFQRIASDLPRQSSSFKGVSPDIPKKPESPNFKTWPKRSSSPPRNPPKIRRPSGGKTGWTNSSGLVILIENRFNCSELDPRVSPLVSNLIRSSRNHLAVSEVCASWMEIFRLVLNSSSSSSSDTFLISTHSKHCNPLAVICRLNSLSCILMDCPSKENLFLPNLTQISQAISSSRQLIFHSSRITIVSAFGYATSLDANDLPTIHHDIHRMVLFIELDEAIDTDELENILDVDVLRDEEDGGEEGDEGERDEEENMKEEEEEEDKMKKMKEKK